MSLFLLFALFPRWRGCVRTPHLGVNSVVSCNTSLTLTESTIYYG